ncbi:MAG: Rne/Rng family ribonuclease [Pseudomonadota bacterium]
MTSTLVVNATTEQTRVALLENGTVVELMIERRRDRGLVGNIYKGRVQRVLPGMQAAFVEIGLEKAAFLYVDDVIEGGAGLVEEDDSERDGAEDAAPRSSKGKKRSAHIEDLLRANQELLVQVAKEAMGTKGARATTHISLPGRFLVFMPTVGHVGISRRITDPEERERLRGIVETLKPPHSGFVVRTVSEGVPQDKLEGDMEFLINLWHDVQRRAAQQGAPSLVHPDLDLVLRATRDLFTADIDRLIVDDRETYERVIRFVQGFAPLLTKSIELYDGATPLFDAYGVETEMARALSRKVWLKSGGYLVWDQAEALTVVDVNTGKFVGRRNLEDTITRTNLEAVREIAYQLRLRNVGGVVVVDFIDMEEATNRQRVLDALNEALKQDRARTHVLGMSELGLVQMTRQRVRDSLLRSLTEPCPHCDGRGFVRSRATVAYEVVRELRAQVAESPAPILLAVCHPDVSAFLCDELGDVLEEIEGWSSKQLIVRGDEALHVEQYSIEATDEPEKAPAPVAAE